MIRSQIAKYDESTEQYALNPISELKDNAGIAQGEVVEFAMTGAVHVEPLKREPEVTYATAKL
jgi:hypothetical protein